MSSETEIKQEIFEIHELFQAWYQGALSKDDLEAKIGIRLAEDFVMTFPDGSLHTKTDLLGMMRPDRGNDPLYRIVISDIEIESHSPAEHRVSYVESQYWVGTEQPNLAIQTQSVLRDSSSGLVWVAIHETKIG